MNVTFTSNAVALESAFRKSPGIVTSELTGWINRTALRTEREAKKDVPPRVDTGQTQSSIQTTFGSLRAEVRPTAPQAIFAHEGRKPGRMPPYKQGSELYRWATKRGINPFLVARSIGRKGIKPHRFMKEAYDTVKPVSDRDAERTLSRIVRKI